MMNKMLFRSFFQSELYLFPFPIWLNVYIYHWNPTNNIKKPRYPRSKSKMAILNEREKIR